MVKRNGVADRHELHDFFVQYQVLKQQLLYKEISYSFVCILIKNETTTLLTAKQPTAASLHPVHPDL